MEAIWRRESLPEAKDFYLAICAAFACFSLHFLLNVALYQKLAIRLLNRETVTRKIEQGNITKCTETMWKLTYYMAVQMFIFYILYKEPWFGERKLLFEGWPDQTIKFPLKLFYMCQCGFHIYSIPALHMRQTRRKDFTVMMSHHVTTVFLTGYSYITRYHFIRDYVQRGVVKLQYISTDEQSADILTKALAKGKFVFFRHKLGVVQNTFLIKREC